MQLLLNRFPLSPDELADVKSAAAKYILPGYAPDAPFLEMNTPVVSIGSCFAEHIAATLVKAGLPVQLLGVGETINMVLGTEEIMTKIISGDTPEYFKARQNLRSASLLILTVGVALQSFLDGQSIQRWGAEVGRRVTFRMLSVDEVYACLRKVIGMARAENPNVHIVLTLSPIPLKMSSHLSVFGQDCLSKSILRTAIEAVLDRNIQGISYWPSFEIVRWLGGHSGPFFGVDGEDNRHVSVPVLDAIMSMFVDHYFKTPNSLSA